MSCCTILISRMSQIIPTGYRKTQSSPNVRKRTFGHVRPAKIQIRLRICAVRSVSSLGAFKIADGAKFLYVDNECTDQTERVRRLIGSSVWRTCQKVLFSRYCSIVSAAVTGKNIRHHRIRLQNYWNFEIILTHTKSLIYRLRGLHMRPRRSRSACAPAQSD